MPIAITAPNVEVGITAVNWDAMVDFYENFLGLEVAGELEFPGGMQRRYSHGSTIVKLLKLEQTPGPTTPGGAAGQGGLRYLTFYVGDLNELASAFEAAGHTVTVAPAPFVPVPGMGWMFGADPDGNWLEFVGTL